MTDKLLHHRVEGSVTAPPLLLGPSLGTSYALLDGVFEKALLAHLTGDAKASEHLRARVLDVLPRLLG